MVLFVVLGYTIMVVHACLGLIGLFGPYITNNGLYLILLLVLNLTVLAQWGIFRRSVITGFENYVLQNDPSTDTITTRPIHWVLGDSSYVLYNLIPYFNGLVICMKLYSQFFDSDPGKYVRTYDLMIDTHQRISGDADA